MSSQELLDDGLNSEQIMTIVDDVIKEYKVGKTKKELKFKHRFFSERYKTLFDMIFEDDFDIKKLQYMLEMRNKIIKNEKSVKEASEEVGTHFLNIYKPK